MTDAQPETYIRAVKLSLKFATKRKLNRLMAIRQEFVRAVRFYIDRLWESKGKEKISASCLENTHLTKTWQNHALYYAYQVIKKVMAVAKKRKQPPQKPLIKHNKTILVSRHVVKHGFVDGKWHDYYFEFTSLKKKEGTKRLFEKIYIPTKATKRLRYWLSKPGATISKGCGLNDKWLILFVKIPAVKKQGDKDIGFDCNIKRLFVDSDGRFYGEEMSKKITRIINCKQGSNNWKGLKTDLRNYARSIVNRLPWSEYDKFYFEDLKKIKYKIRKRIKSKRTRRYLTHWPVGDVRRFLEMRAVENGVFVSFEKPSWTSTTCPTCGRVDRGNRVGDLFKCVKCGYENHADTVGALNVLIKGRSASIENNSLRKNTDNKPH